MVKEKSALSKQIASLEAQHSADRATAAEEQRGLLEELTVLQGELDVCRQDLAVAHVAAEERLKQDAAREQSTAVVRMKSHLYSTFFAVAHQSTQCTN